MNAADAVRALASVPEPLLMRLAPLSHTALTALAAWLDAADPEHTEPSVLDQLPDTLKSELALARAEARAKGGGG